MSKQQRGSRKVQQQDEQVVRVVRNGVRSRKPGGRCAQVWDRLDKMVAGNDGGVPALAQILRYSNRRGWNENNTRAEYYAWRKFHGIAGRDAAGSDRRQRRVRLPKGMVDRRRK